MKYTITIDLESAKPYISIGQALQRNIDALDRVVEGKMQVRDITIILDTKSILEGVRRELQRLEAGRKE